MNREAATRQRPLHLGNRMLTLLFVSLGCINLLGADFLDAGVWLALGAALLALGEESTPWASIPLWRRAFGGALTLIALAALAARLWLDFNS